MMMNRETYNRSLNVAQEIVDISENLTAIEAEVEYSPREQFLQSLLGTDGYTTFVPEVSMNIVDPFKTMLHEGVSELQRDYYRKEMGQEQDIARQLWYLSDFLREDVTSDGMLANMVPASFKGYVEKALNDRYNSDKVKAKLREFKSPKLSKILVKLWGEQHEIVKWFTSKCPKNLTKGLNDKYRVTVSILPHHIAGMSYYGSLNHGGDRWMEGYEGTSCMDTKRNGKGEGIYQLMPCLKDETMAVAYLSYKEDNDIWKPVFQARALLRINYVEGKPFIIACRSYYTSNEISHILINGLKNKFGIVHSVRDIRGFSGDEYEHVHEFTEDITFKVNAEIKCRHCEATGKVERYGEMRDCNYCEGEGKYRLDDEFTPYTDDEDILYIHGNKVEFRIPKDYLKSVGIEVPEQAEEELFTADDLKTADVISEDSWTVAWNHNEVAVAAVDFEAGEEEVIRGLTLNGGGMGFQGFGELNARLEDATVDIDALREALGLPINPFVRMLERDEGLTMFPVVQAVNA